MKFIVIGGGLVGLGTARALRKSAPDAQITLLEKEATLGAHQSTHNSGVLHAGLYYKPGTLKAKLAVEGIRKMVTFCEENRVPHEVCGKLVIATKDEEVARLRVLLDRGRQNGLKGLRWLDPGALREIEPHAAGLAAVHVPEEGIVSYPAVCAALERELAALGVQLVTRAKVTHARPDQSGWKVESSAGEHNADYAINCAGLHCDRVAAAFGEARETRILPFRGEYYQLRPEAQHLVRHLIYPTPDPAFPFLGVHFTRLIGGGVEAGPNAVLALSREGYGKADLRVGDLIDALSYAGLWKFLRRHRRMAWEEARRSFSKELFCQSLQKLVPDLRVADLAPGGSGVRAQAMLRDGTLVQDFQFLERPNALHVLNAPSPAATASLAIGEHIAARALALARAAQPVM